MYEAKNDNFLSKEELFFNSKRLRIFVRYFIIVKLGSNYGYIEKIYSCIFILKYRD